jgi:hypothetical protein
VAPSHAYARTTSAFSLRFRLRRPRNPPDPRPATRRGDGARLSCSTMAAADAEHIRALREKAARYPALARDALRGGDTVLAEEYWRRWHETIDEILRLVSDAPP